MQKNVGKADRALRVALGLGILVLGLVFKSWWGAFGIVPLFTATLGWCPVYLPFGINTCNLDRPKN